MQFRHLSLLFIFLLSFTLVFQHSIKSDLPLSWDVWYHLRISRQFCEGEFVWDAGSFGPEGRPHIYPPLFHLFTALLYTITGIPLEIIAQVMAPFLFAASIVSFYFLVKEVVNEKVALISCLLAAVCPILLDRGTSYTPEVVAFILFNVGVTFFLKGKWVITGLLGGLLVLTHGIASVAFFSVIFTYCIFSFLIFKENYWKLFFQVVIMSILISSFWLFRSVTTFLPYGGMHVLSYYPQKLGWIQTVLGILGITCLSKDRKSIFILSCAGVLLLLTRNPFSLPYRFIEFLAFPVCMLAGIGLYHIVASKRVEFLVVIFLIAFAQGYWYTEKYTPVITEEEKTAFIWLSTNSVKGYTAMCEWRTAPVLAYFSDTPPIKGAYQFGALAVEERTKDTTVFYTTYPQSLLSKYETSHIYYGKEEQGYKYATPPFDKVYTSLQTGFYHC